MTINKPADDMTTAQSDSVSDKEEVSSKDEEGKTDMENSTDPVTKVMTKEPLTDLSEPDKKEDIQPCNNEGKENSASPPTEVMKEEEAVKSESLTPAQNEEVPKVVEEEEAVATAVVVVGAAASDEIKPEVNKPIPAFDRSVSPISSEV